MATFEMRKVEVNGKDVMRPYNLKTNKQYESKSQASAVIYREIQNDDSVDPKHRRAEYLNRVAAELALSKHGGSTYYHNEQKAERGEDKFAFNRAANKKAAARKKAEKEARTIEGECEEVPTTKSIESKPEKDSLERWQVVLKDTRAVIDSFKGRTAAQTFNKAQKASGVKSVMVDGNKKAA